MSDNDSSSSSEYSDGSKYNRANRWKGSDTTWMRLTEEERGIANSLTALRDRDLSVHLYNAFALKKGAWECKGGKKKLREVCCWVRRRKE